MRIAGWLTCAFFCVLAADLQGCGGNWELTDELEYARGQHSATLLRDGRVLVAGGVGEPVGSGGATSELYDPVSDTWSSGPPMRGERRGHVAALLKDGRVLVAGGDDGVRGVVKSAEVYDPAANAWSATGSMTQGPFPDRAAALLKDGR